MVNVNNNTNPTHAFVVLDAVIMPLCSTCGAYFSILNNSPENRGVWRSEMALLRLRSCVAISSCWFARIKFSSCRNAQQVKG